jgi:4-diphosphocytidyl-2-C-methyl-D-erythritol kinase
VIGDTRRSHDISELARAKINLTLRVLGRRPDGYHEIESLVAFADFGDIVTLVPGAARALITTGPFASDIDGENLVARALERLSEREPPMRLGAVRLEKNIPVAAGLGGGSADAAAALRAIWRANSGCGGGVDWPALAAGLGADVPVCLSNSPALVWGIGANVAPVEDVPPLNVVLINPRVPVLRDKTARVFAQLAAPASAPRSAAPLCPSFGRDVSRLLTYVRAYGNELGPAVRVLFPVVVMIEAVLAAADGCLLVQVSGAGPTCYGVFAGEDLARAGARAIAAARPDWWVRAAMLV